MYHTSLPGDGMLSMECDGSEVSTTPVFQERPVHKICHMMRFLYGSGKRKGVK